MALTLADTNVFQTGNVSVSLLAAKPLIATTIRSDYLTFSVTVSHTDFTVSGKNKLALTIPDGYMLTMMGFQVIDVFDSDPVITFGDSNSKTNVVASGQIDSGTLGLISDKVFWWSDTFNFFNLAKVADGSDVDIYLWASCGTLPTTGSAEFIFYCFPFTKLTKEVVYTDFVDSEAEPSYVTIGSIPEYSHCPVAKYEITEVFDGVCSFTDGKEGSLGYFVDGKGSVDLTTLGVTVIEQDENWYELEGL